MRKLLVGSAVVAASLGLVACGGNGSPAATKAGIKQFVSSLGASPNLQVALAASASGTGSAEAQKVLKKVSMVLLFSNPSGAALSEAAGKSNTEILLKVNGTTFVDIRQIDSNLYFKVDVTKFSSIPGVNLPASELGSVQLVFGGRWFEIPQSLLNSIVPKKNANAAKTQGDKAAAAKVINALAKIIDTSHYKTLPNGYSESGTLQGIVNAVAPTITSITHKAVPSTKGAKGTYVLVITTSRSTTTGGSISVTAPNGKHANGTAKVTVGIAHANISVVAPSGATVITQQLIDELKASAG